MPANLRLTLKNYLSSATKESREAYFCNYNVDLETVSPFETVCVVAREKFVFDSGYVLELYLVEIQQIIPVGDLTT